MFYASAGQQAGQQQPQRGMSMGPSGFPPMSGALGRAGPPGFGSRTDHSDFPALNASIHAQHSSYAQAQAQAQSSQAQGQSQSQQQQLYHQSQMSGLAPPPPPGIAGPTSPSPGVGSTSGANGESLRGEDFPALGGDKDRMNYLRSQQPTSPGNMPNGSSHPLSAAGSASAGQGGSVAGTSASAAGAGAGASGSAEQWARHSPVADTHPSQQQPQPQSQSRPAEPIVRPAQQILQSPVDKWGLKALLYEITTQMGKTDRGMLMFGEELAELGLDMMPEEPLYPSFVTPWADPSQIQQSRIQEMYAIPPQYAFNPTQMSTKMGQMSEETLMIAFYSSPQDLVQVEAAAELFARGWRYHMDWQIWLNGPSINQYEPPSPSQSPSLSNAGDLPPTGASAGNGAGANGNGNGNSKQPASQWLHGPFLYFDPKTFTRNTFPEEASFDTAVIEWTMPSVSGLEKADTQGQQQR